MNQTVYVTLKFPNSEIELDEETEMLVIKSDNLNDGVAFHIDQVAETTIEYNQEPADENE